MEMDMEDDGRPMLIAFGIFILFFAWWTAFHVSIALLRQRGYGPHPILAALLLWPLIELIWTWIWASFHRKQLVKIDSPRRKRGQALIAMALFLPAPLYFVLNVIESTSGWPAITMMIGTTVAGCWAARITWSRVVKNRASSEAIC
jgi:hypothetical protein